MTMLTYAPGLAVARPQPARTAETPSRASMRNRIVQACGMALTITLLTAALGAIIALKAAIYLERFGS